MKIKCEYCGGMFNDTLDVCPYCGAANHNVRRSAGDQPLTIEDLKAWYESKGLPPYETTRFFIGVNCTEPKAFGIYKDETDGNFIVYKNKASGERAVRYKGTDEAYAVNELFQRLKQEIIEQKMHNVQNGAGSNTDSKSSAFSDDDKASKRKRMFRHIKTLLLFIVVAGLIIWSNTSDYPAPGYYEYEAEEYYYGPDDYGEWYRFDTASSEWEGPLNEVADDLYYKNSAKDYFVSTDWSQGLSCTDFNDSVQAKDIAIDYAVKKGYYRVADTLFYNFGYNYADDWFTYDDDWHQIDAASLPDELKHPSTAADFYYTPTWDSSTQASDFEDTELYSTTDEQLSELHSSDYDSDDSSDSGFFNWGSGDSWSSSSSDWDSDW